MTREEWLQVLAKGDDVFVHTGEVCIPAVVTRVTKVTIYVRRLKFRRKDGSMIREGTFPARAARRYRLVQSDK